MIVPQYWAEARVTRKINGRQMTVRRFGWSDVSQEEAQGNAEQRLGEAVARMESGKSILKSEPKVAYNGAEGVPIREEIVSRHQDAVITRNSYGALCLNTPDVLFADIDFEEPAGASSYLGAFVTLAVAAAIVAYVMGSSMLFLIGLVVCIILAAPLVSWINKAKVAAAGGFEERALKQINQFMEKHPDWHLRLYRTPVGFRILVMHQAFDPNSQEAYEFFEAIKADPIYVRMCKNQHCFRARVSPKPWRTRLGSRIPSTGVWPLPPEKLAARRNWVADYEKVALEYSACRFHSRLGSDRTDPKAETIRSLHDQYCRSDKNLALA